MEVVDFYDFSASYPQGYDKESPDADAELAELTNDIQLGEDETELILPSGIRVGHRSMQRYYKQSFKPDDVSCEVVAIRDLFHISNLFYLPVSRLCLDQQVDHSVHWWLWLWIASKQHWSSFAVHDHGRKEWHTNKEGCICRYQTSRRIQDQGRNASQQPEVLPSPDLTVDFLSLISHFTLLFCIPLFFLVHYHQTTSSYKTLIIIPWSCY